MYTTHTNCRLCNGHLITVLNLGNIHVSSFVDTNDNPTPKIPIELTECAECHLMQLRDTVDGDVMYLEYWYKSGLNNFMVDALRDVVTETLKRRPINADDVIVDIGANDGTLLRQYPDIVKSRAKLIAYEPSNIGLLAKDSCNTLINDYFTADKYPEKRKAKIITSIAMFYDLEYPHRFIEDVRKILISNGVWTIQFMDLVSMLKTNDFPNLCHEHLEYYTLRILSNVLVEHGLEIFDAEYNAVNGSSLRVYVGHRGFHPVTQSVIGLLHDEDTYLESLGNPADHFREAIQSVKEKVITYIQHAYANGKSIAVLGASTKGNTILQYFGLDNRTIDHAAEINPDKYGKRTIGSNIPIIPQTESLQMHPDYYLILPWGFLNNFLKKFDNYLREGGKFIVPLPEPCIIEYKDGVLCQILL